MSYIIHIYKVSFPLSGNVILDSKDQEMDALKSQYPVCEGNVFYISVRLGTFSMGCISMLLVVIVNFLQLYNIRTRRVHGGCV